jgi:hypothetical protein
MKWTQEMLDAVKGNETPHGILKTKGSAHDIVWRDGQSECRMPLWSLIEAAAKEGARMEIYTARGWEYTPAAMFDSLGVAYHVSPSWQPPAPKTLEQERREFMDQAFKRGNVVRFMQGNCCKYVKDWTPLTGATKALGVYMRANAFSSTDGCNWTWEEYTLTEMTPQEAEADCKARGGKVPEKAGEVERCEVTIDEQDDMTFRRARRAAIDYLLHRAQSMPDFIAYEYQQGNAKSLSSRPRLCANPEQGNPARIPVAVLFRRQT